MPGNVGTLAQEQLNAFFVIMGESKLNSELDELTQIEDNDNFYEINKGTADAKAVRPSVARGYLGQYNANTNTPSLADGIGIDGDTYIISVAGSRDFGSGVITFIIDDFVKYVDGKWRREKLVTLTSQLVNNSSDAVGNNHFASQVEIGGYAFLLMKSNLTVGNRTTLETNDVVIGYDDLGNFLMAKYKGGTVTLFQDDTVYEKFGGF